MGTSEPASPPRTASTTFLLPLVAGLVVGFIAGTVIGRATAPKAPSLSGPVAAAEPEPATRVIPTPPPLGGGTQLDYPRRASVPTLAFPTQPPIRVEPFTISGNGKEASRLFDLEATLYVFKFDYPGPSNFIVHLLAENGQKYGPSLANEIGPFTGSKALRIERRGKYLLDVDASAPWTALIGPPESR